MSTTLTPPPPPRREPLTKIPVGLAHKVLTLAPRTKPPIVPKIVMYAGEKFGKTSLLAHAPDPVILMVGETGYDTLLSAGRVPAVPALVVETWPHGMDVLEQLIADPQGRKTVGIDGIGALDMMAQAFVCERSFGGDWDDPKDGFLSWGAKKGHTQTAMEWARMLAKLETLRTHHGIVPVLLGHATVQNTPNPAGADYQTYSCDCCKMVWAETARWSDCILFGRFHSVVEVAKSEKKKNVAEQKGKGIGGADRVIYTEGRDAYVAGNRYGMLPEFSLPPDPAAMWSTVWNEIVRTK